MTGCSLVQSNVKSSSISSISSVITFASFLFVYMFTLQVYVRSSSLCSLFKSMFALLGSVNKNVSRQPFQLAAVRNITFSSFLFQSICSLFKSMFALQVYVRSSSLCSLFKSMFVLQVYIRSSSLCSLFLRVKQRTSVNKKRSPGNRFSQQPSGIHCST